MVLLQLPTVALSPMLNGVGKKIGLVDMLHPRHRLSLTPFHVFDLLW
jgi:hypothetical protein